MRIVYIVSLNSKSGFKYQALKGSSFGYTPKHTFNKAILTPSESLEKSLKWLRNFYGGEILVITESPMVFLKTYEATYKPLEKDPALQRIPLFLNEIDDYGVFVEHDVSIFEPFNFGDESFVSLGSSLRPSEFCGEFFGLRKDDIETFYKEYQRVQSIRLQSQIHNCVYGVLCGFKKINSIKKYDIIVQPEFDNPVPKGFIGIHSHFDLYPEDLN